uniref:Uncharacterized protein n=1 Tax=Arundo donax TaxID=35708 RepID=A0A0A9BKQ2_ARUDO
MLVAMPRSHYGRQNAVGNLGARRPAHVNGSMGVQLSVAL